MTDWVFSLIDALGPVGVGLLILLENLVPPIPSEVVLPLAGFRSSTGALSWYTVWPAATAGSVLGALLLHGIGAWLGYDRLYGLAGRRWFIFTGQKDMETRLEALRRSRRQDRTSREVRTLHPQCRLHTCRRRQDALGRFLVLTALGSGVWNAVFIGLGYLLGSNWSSAQIWVGPASHVARSASVIVIDPHQVRAVRDNSA